MIGGLIELQLVSFRYVVQGFGSWVVLVLKKAPSLRFRLSRFPFKCFDLAVVALPTPMELHCFYSEAFSRRIQS